MRGPAGFACITNFPRRPPWYPDDAPKPLVGNGFRYFLLSGDRGDHFDLDQQIRIDE